MKKAVKITLLLSLICLSSLFSYKACYFIGEKYFFDKLFYMKSETHGYSERGLNILKYKNSREIENRIKDLRNLTAIAHQEKNQVFGAQNTNDYRIAVIGDSMVYGQGVKTHERFSEILENKLNKVYPTKVFTLGMMGDDILDNYVKFLLAKKHLDIDLYIIGIVANDLLIGNHKKYPDKETIYKDLKAVCTKEEFVSKNPDPDISWEQLVVDAYYPSSLDQYANPCFLEEIVKAMASDNVMFYMLVEVPSISDITENSSEYDKKWVYFLNKVVSVIKKNRGGVVYCSNLRDFVRENVSEKESHPSKKTHLLYAESLFKEITENPKWGFKSN
jgi:hypothetical protein